MIREKVTPISQFFSLYPLIEAIILFLDIISLYVHHFLKINYYEIIINYSNEIK